MISTHILDTGCGQPAASVNVELEKQDGENWSKVDANKTNDDGRISFNCPSEAGMYRLCFAVGKYYKRSNTECFFPQAHIVFEVKDTNRKYHVPLLLNSFGYTTYRGS